jgi:hypothetical protein
MTAAPFQTACHELKAIGIVLRKEPGLYRVNFRNGPAATEYVTDNLQDAIARGRDMAAQAPAPTAPPLGPMGPRSRRGIMYRHNRKIAARRIRQQKLHQV